MKRRTRITIVADLPDDLCGPYLQHIVDFDSTHAQCDFAVKANCVIDVPVALMDRIANPEDDHTLN